MTMPTLRIAAASTPKSRLNQVRASGRLRAGSLNGDPPDLPDELGLGLGRVEFGSKRIAWTDDPGRAELLGGHALAVASGPWRSGRLAANMGVSLLFLIQRLRACLQRSGHRRVCITFACCHRPANSVFINREDGNLKCDSRPRRKPGRMGATARAELRRRRSVRQARSNALGSAAFSVSRPPVKTG